MACWLIWLTRSQAGKLLVRTRHLGGDILKSRNWVEMVQASVERKRSLGRPKGYDGRVKSHNQCYDIKQIVAIRTNSREKGKSSFAF